MKNFLQLLRGRTGDGALPAGSRRHVIPTITRIPVRLSSPFDPVMWPGTSPACPPATENIAAEDELAALPAVPNLIATEVPGSVPPHAAINAAQIRVNDGPSHGKSRYGILVRIGVALLDG